MLDEFYLPEAKDFCKGALDKGTRHCTYGWMNVFEIGADKKIYILWHKAATTAGIPGPDRDIIHRNDHPKTTLAQLARAFELFVEKLGYEVVDA